MNIHPILYQTTREIYNVEDKLSIASLILFCNKLGNKTFCELLYTDNHKKFIENLSDDYKDYEINLYIRLDDKNINNSFLKTIEAIKLKYDSNGYLKALFEKDSFALVIDEIVNYDFKKMEVKSFAKAVNGQLKLMFN